MPHEPTDESHLVNEHQLEQLRPRFRITPGTTPRITILGQEMTSIRDSVERANEQITSFGETYSAISDLISNQQIIAEFNAPVNSEIRDLWFDTNSHNQERNEQPHESGAGAMPYTPAMFTMEQQDLPILPNGVYEAIPEMNSTHPAMRFMLTTVRAGQLRGQRIIKVECDASVHRTGWTGIATLMNNGRTHVWSRCVADWSTHWLTQDIAEYFEAMVVSITAGSSRRFMTTSGTKILLTQRYCSMCNETINVNSLTHTCSNCTRGVRERREQRAYGAGLDELRSRLASPAARAPYSDLNASNPIQVEPTVSVPRRGADRVQSGENNNQQDLIRSLQTSDVNMRSVK